MNLLTIMISIFLQSNNAAATEFKTPTDASSVNIDKEKLVLLIKEISLLSEADKNIILNTLSGDLNSTNVIDIDKLEEIYQREEAGMTSFH